MMKNIFVPHLQVIPEWKDCYYDYDTLEKLFSLMSESAYLFHSLKIYRQQLRKNEVHNKEIQHTQRLIVSVQKVMFPCNQRFYEYSQILMTVIYMFVQQKTFEIREKLQKYKEYANKLPKGSKDILALIQNLFIETYYLNKMVSYNMVKQKVTVLKLQQLTDKFGQLKVNVQVNRKMPRIKWVLNELSGGLEELYMIKNNRISDEAKRQLHQTSDSMADTRKYIYLFGFWTGVAIVGLICLVYFDKSKNININDDKQFKSVFPMWRGASYILFYFWVLGTGILLCQILKIDYKLVMQMDSSYIPNGISILTMAAIFTSLFMVLFNVYYLEKSTTLPTTLNYHYSGVAWLLLLIFLFLPLPILGYKGRLYFFKVLVNVALSPCIRVTFLMIWVTQQIVSFNQPFSDFCYTVCKYVNYESDCGVSILLGTIFLSIFFTYRMIQNLKMGFQTKSPFYSAPFMGFFRGLLSLNTVIAGYVDRVYSNSNTFIYWLFFAIVTTIYAWYIDVKWDWGLFSNVKGSRILRPRLIFPNYKFIYYIVIVVDFILRGAWTLNISPEIVKQLGILPYIFTMILSYLQIFRRGIWNFFRIQCEHFKNCDRFQPIIDYSAIEKRVKDKYHIISKKNFQEDPYQDLTNIRKKTQLQRFTQLLQSRIEFKSILIKEIQELTKVMTSIQNDLSNQFKNYPRK